MWELWVAIVIHHSLSLERMTPLKSAIYPSSSLYNKAFPSCSLAAQVALLRKSLSLLSNRC